MNIPGFTADAALYKTIGRYLMYTDGRISTSIIAVLPQRSIVCDIEYDRCSGQCDDQICPFDDVGDACGACFDLCGVDNTVCEAIFSPPPASL